MTGNVIAKKVNKHGVQSQQYDSFRMKSFYCCKEYMTLPLLSGMQDTHGVRHSAHTHFISPFTDGDSDSEEYEDSDSESEDPFTSHQARRQTAAGSQRGALPPFYNYPGAGWTPPFSSAPPLP